MNEDEFSKMMQTKAVPGSVQPNTPNQSDGAIIRTVMTKTVFRVYKNGEIYLDKQACSQWVLEHKEVFKRKEKPKPKKKTELKSRDDEVY